MAKRPSYLQYANDETPPPLSIGILAVQHSAIVTISLVYVIIITKSLNLSAADQFAMLSTTLLIVGLGTVLQAQFGSRLLIMFHPNPIFIPLIIAAGKTGGLGGIAVMLTVQLLFNYLPLMNRLFHSAPVRAETWLHVTLVGLVAFLLIELEKRFRFGRNAGNVAISG